MLDTAGIEYLMGVLYGIGMLTIFGFLVVLSYFLSKLWRAYK